MSGQQIVRGHDVADLFFADNGVLAFTRQTLDPSQPEPQDLWVYGPGDEAPEIALPGIDWAPPVSWVNLQIGTLLQTGPDGRLFYDFVARQGTDLLAFGSAPAGTAVATSYPPMSAVRMDGGAVALTANAGGAIGVGPPASLRRFDLPGRPLLVTFLATDVVTLFAPDAADPPSAGIYRVSSETGQMTELVAPAPLDDWGPSTNSCFGFGPDPCPLFKVIGCGDFGAACADTGVVPCVIVYVKDDPDNPGQTAPYAYDVNAGMGFKLPGDSPRHLYVSPDRQLLVWDDREIVSKRYWNLCSGKQDFCPQAAGAHLLWRGDSRGFASLTDDGQLAVAHFDANLCDGQTIASSAYAAFYSPSGTRMAWLAPDDGQGAAAGLWVGDQDGNAPMLVDAGTFSGARFSPDEGKMLVSRSAASSVSLAWIDMLASPPTEHPLVQNYGGFSRMGNRRVLLVDGWNTQDGSGDLTLLDMTTGSRAVLGRAVTSFATSGGGVDDGGTNLAYVARSRVSSDRDGLWLTTLPP